MQRLTHSHIRFALLTTAVLAAAAIGCATTTSTVGEVEARITRVVVVIDSAGMQTTYFVDPRRADAVFFSDDTRDQYYEGAGSELEGPRADIRDPAISTISPVALVAPPDPCVHCRYGLCSCGCVNVGPPREPRSPITKVGVYIEGSGGGEELRWLRPERVGAVFLTREARSQFFGGRRLERNLSPGPERIVSIDSSAVPTLAAGASLYLRAP